MSKIERYISETLEISLEEIKSFQLEFERISVQKNNKLLLAGQICNRVFFVEKGLLRMYSEDKNGKEHIIQFATESWLISDRSSMFFNEKSIYTIESVEASEVLLLPPNFFNKLVERFPDSISKSDILIQKHIKSLQDRINSLLCDTAETRYLNFLKMYPDIMQRVPQWMVASYLGITPEGLSRVRKDLKRKWENNRH